MITDPTAKRRREIRELMQLSPDEVRERAGERLVVCEDMDELHRRFAEMMAAEIREHNERDDPTRLILPVGPAGQYPILADLINREQLPLENCWFFYMDENCGEDGRAVPIEHPLSFQGNARRLFLDNLDPERRPAAERVLFPNEDNLDELSRRVEEVGGIDTCYGGIGIHGHIAFNEPEPGVCATGYRKVRLNDYTVTINCIRDACGGNLECYPREAFTVGMKQILGARRLRLFCRNGIALDWANTVLRVALFGAPGDDYPVTHIRDKDYVITTDKATLRTPRNLI
jgi:glucosamine-6-phosphate deaminase